VAYSQQGRHKAAIARLRAALALDASQAAVHCSLGNCLLATRQTGEAVAAFRAAIAVSPDYADAHGNLGAALQSGGELEAAAMSFRRAVSLDAHRVDDAVCLSYILQQLDRTDEAISTLLAATAANPNSAHAHYALGVARHRCGQLAGAVACYERALALSPGLAPVWRDRGRALESLQLLADALASYQRAVALAPDDTASVAGALSCSVRTCEWTQAAQGLQRLRTLPSGLSAIHPFLALSVSDEPAEQLGIARCYGRGAAAIRTSSVPSSARGRCIRVAYLSSDLRDHAVAHLLVGVIESHDDSEFEIHAVALQPLATDGAIHHRMLAAVGHYHDVSSRSDAATARLLRDLAIDVAVDLNGYTIGGRPGIFAHRAAPVQVGYLGYPGTLGAPYMDYLLADAVVIPAGEERWYSEQVVRLPHCYLPNDDTRPVGAAPTRAAAGLPEGALVFCAFTNPYKINPPVFDVWMRLLREVPGSVLWLRAMSAQASANLALEAQRRGVGAERLVYAPRMESMAEHLGRQSLADLYLDTLPYNAHSTACDALWAGVPVLSCAGRSFASRVAASALTAVGLPELITYSLQEYEQRALELARRPEQLAALRVRLAAARRSAPLFDTARHTRYLEAAYRTMHQRAAAGQQPQAFDLDDDVATAPVMGLGPDHRPQIRP
jgi:predicted O-linked N-acetylglucosamine transferase (SPINDLY family)